MVTGSVDALLGLLDRLGLWGLALAMALECGGFPVPSELVLPLGGLMAARGRATIFTATLAATAGGLAGSFAVYAVARWGGRPLLARLGGWLGLTAEHQAAERWFRERGDWAVFICRMIPGLRTLVSIPAGAAAMPVARFLWLTLLGSLPWSFALIWAGYLLGDRWALVRERLAVADHLAVTLLGIALLAWCWRRRRPR